LLLHRYPPRLVDELPSQATARFLGIGNLWTGAAVRDARRVVDIGCGTGVDLGIARANCSEGAFLIGVDKRPSLIEIASQACPDARFVVGDICAVPLASRSFDLILANGLPPLQRPTLLASTARNLYSLLRDGGQVLATVIVTAQHVITDLLEAYPSRDGILACNLATLLSGKPTRHDLESTFAAMGAQVLIRDGANPYSAPADRELTAAVLVVAARPHPKWQ
jgi:SAM-dependent methyltransferase